MKLVYLLGGMILKKQKILLNNVYINDLYWVRLPENMPNGLLNKVLVTGKSGITVSVDLSHKDCRFRNINTYQFSTIDFIEKILNECQE